MKTRGGTMQIKFDDVKKYDTISETERERLKKIYGIIKQKESMLDWTDIKTCISKEELQKIVELSNEVRTFCDIFIVIGIGGSYLGSKAVIEALSPYFNKNKPEIIFAGHQLSASYLKELLTYIKDKSVVINVISKSGGTLEPSIAFDEFYTYMKENYQDYKKRIIVTTDQEAGNLRNFAIQEGLSTLSIPREIGGRYSVMTTVGLFPIAVSGIDIIKLLKGAKEAKDCFEDASRYALIRKHMEEDNKFIEAITVYEEKLSSFAGWCQQLFAETQGKEGKGILPIINQNTTNLHSIGQYLQEGKNIVFETVITVEDTEDIFLDKYNMTMNELNNVVAEQVSIAHKLSNTPSIKIILEELSPTEIGKLIYLYEMTAAIGGYLLDINPFDQPGVEEYKKLVIEELEKNKKCNK